MDNGAEAERAPRILLGVTGSIAAYKACELARLIVKRIPGARLRVAMTAAAREFVAPLTFQTLSRNPVAADQFAPPAAWEPEHVALADSDVAVVAPCTANMIAKMANGIADDLLSSVLLATKAPVVVAPAMNDGMWTHPATRRNVALLRERGTAVISPGEGELACGSSGPGRLAEVEKIFAAVAAALGGSAAGV